MRIIWGDCRAVLPTLAENSVDAIITDPPYHLVANKREGANCASPDAKQRAKKGFMGMQWDGGDVAFQPATWAAALRVLKPGGFLVAFGGTRTYHRLVCAIEDGGFEVRDMLVWLYGGGFPKGTDKAKIPAPWAGWNTALKPAIEPVCLGRKAMVGTLAANLAQWGTGALWIDGCRIETDESLNGGAYSEHAAARAGTWTQTRKADSKAMRNGGAGEYQQPRGRWPANVLHDGSDEVIALFPTEAGASAPVRGSEDSPASVGRVTGKRARVPGAFHADAGSAARFFYTSKATRFDRNDGCADLPAQALNWSSGEQSPGTFQSPNTDRSARNHHPTVKPTDLMRWLCRLVTPPGGIVLDPFLGSGSTLKAAELEGFAGIGIELDPAYVAIAQRRIGSDMPLFAPGLAS